MQAASVQCMHCFFPEKPVRVAVAFFTKMKLDKGIGVVREVGRILVAFGGGKKFRGPGRQLIPLFAGDLAALAGNAFGCIN